MTGVAFVPQGINCLKNGQKFAAHPLSLLDQDAYLHHLFSPHPLVHMPAHAC